MSPFDVSSVWEASTLLFLLSFSPRRSLPDSFFLSFFFSQIPFSCCGHVWPVFGHPHSCLCSSVCLPSPPCYRTPVHNYVVRVGCGSRARQRRAQSGRGREANPLQIGMSAGGSRPQGASPGCSIPVNGLLYVHSTAVVIGLVSRAAQPNDEAIRLLGRCLPVYEAADARMPTAVCCSQRPAVLAFAVGAVARRAEVERLTVEEHRDESVQVIGVLDDGPEIAAAEHEAPAFLALA